VLVEIAEDCLLTVSSPLNLVGMPYYREMLFSAWPSHLVSEVGAPPSKIDAGILASLKRSDIGGYASFPRKTRRYQFEDTRAVQRAHDTLSAPRFLSERQKDDSQGHEGPRRMSDALEALGDLALAGATRRDVPVMYRNVEIKYSKFGVDDFDFEWVPPRKLHLLVTNMTQVLQQNKALWTGDSHCKLVHESPLTAFTLHTNNPQPGTPPHSYILPLR
jgi:PAB-dependent poly(A)-specific ribonuclease subunit 2